MPGASSLFLLTRLHEKTDNADWKGGVNGKGYAQRLAVRAEAFSFQSYCYNSPHYVKFVIANTRRQRE